MYPTSTNGSDISSTSGSYLYLIGANSTTAPGSAPVNNIPNTGGDQFYLETDVWSYNPVTAELTAVWSNGQDSVPLTFAFSNGLGPLLTGDYAALILPSTATSTAKIVQETD
ncbi:hypothetical protein EHS25_005182 [Saitozyma podzolica]|uniref:Uncharacterized protein n=1 Tax=Saitozyma podzolica TaxID=1890683 RepID=A0A427XYH9_9TREE|nr:hypothetical protein EHS25_005182 [Saitozyma podzolica]